MSSELRNKVAQHYNRYPYPSYPLYALGSWKNLDAVDLSRWPLSFLAKEVWLAGCGTIQPLMFARRNPHARFLATDISTSSLWRARWRCWLWGFHNVSFRFGDICEADFENRFDAIDAFGVLHHLNSPELGLSKIYRALKPGGVLRFMLYSEKAREEIEALRKKVRESEISDMKGLRRFLKHYPELRWLPTAELADAYLHPQVTTFSRTAIERLFHPSKGWDIIRLEQPSHYVGFARRLGETP